jgi:hypothetical protein
LLQIIICTPAQQGNAMESIVTPQYRRPYKSAFNNSRELHRREERNRRREISRHGRSASAEPRARVEQRG